MAPKKLDRLLTASEIASRIGVPPKQVRRAIRRGELRAVRIGAWWRASEADAIEWINSKREPTTHSDSDAGARP